jgi:hypothetical protein
MIPLCSFSGPALYDDFIYVPGILLPLQKYSEITLSIRMPTPDSFWVLLLELSSVLGHPSGA